MNATFSSLSGFLATVKGTLFSQYQDRAGAAVVG